MATLNPKATFTKCPGAIGGDNHVTEKGRLEKGAACVQTQRDELLSNTFLWRQT